MARQDTFSPRYLILSDPSTSPPTPRKQYDRLRGDVEIGRGSKNDSSATDPHSGKFRTNETKVMSARHAKLTWENGRPCLTDVGSTNGTAITREGDKRMLGKGASYRINDGDVITFGRQVDNRQTIVCRPVVLVASFSSEAVFPSSSSSRSSSTANFARSAAPSIESVPLARSRTLDSKLGELVHLDDSDDEDEMHLEATQRIPPSTFDSRPATKRVGFGLSEEDLLVSAAEEEGDKDVMADESSSDIDAAKTTFMPPRLLSAAASKAESVASIAAISSLSVRGSPVPEINKELLDELEADLAARACEDLDHSPSVELDGRPLSPVSPEERRSGSSASHAPSEGVYAASRKLVDQLQPRQRRLRAFLTSDDEAAMLAPAEMAKEQDKAEDDAEEDEEELAELPAPSSLFDKPTRDNLESFGFNVDTLDKTHQQRLSSEMDQLSQSGSHLPSPVLSPRSDDEELMAMSDEDEVLRPVDMPAPKQQQDSPFKLGATSSREASPAVSDLAGSQFFLPTPALATALLSTTDDFRDDLLMGYKSASEDEEAVRHEDEDEHVSRPGTPVGRGFSPPATSPVERSLKAYLHDLDEQERLVRDAETEEPDQAAEEQAPSSLFEGEEGEVTQGFASGSTTPGDLDSVDEAAYDVAPLAVKPAPIQIKWTFAAGRFQKEEMPKNALAEREERVAPPATADEQEEQEEQDDEEEEEEENDQDSPVSDLSELSGEEDEDESADDKDESDPIEDADSDFEADSAAFDPDLDAVDLDVDGAVAKDEDEGMQSADEVDERDGMGVEEEKWEDGVSEGLFQQEQQEEDEGEKVESEDEDNGYTSDGKVYAPHAFEKPMSPPAEKTYRLPDSPLLDPTLFDGSSTASSSPRKRRFSDTDLEEPVLDSSSGKKQAVELVSSSAADNAQGSLDVAPAAGAETVTLVTAAAVEEPAPKRRRIGGGFGFRSFALGLATGMVAAVGGLSYLGGLMEDDL